MTPDDIHSLVLAVVNLLYAVGGFLASHYAARAGAAIATTGAATAAAVSTGQPVKPVT
jgi:hypothetical protein